MLSTIEKRRKGQEQRKEQEKPPIQVEDMSGELQTIPARHGVATFVPRGRTIKVINTYGKQVVSMWAFSLGAPPEDGDEDEPSDKEIEEGAKKLEEAAEEEEGQGGDVIENKQDAPAETESTEQTSQDQDDEKKEQPESAKDEEAKEEHEDPPEEAPDTPDNEKVTENTKDSTEKTAKQPSKRTWASYLPSIPYRSKGKGKGDDAEKTEGEQEPSPEEQKAQNEANTKKWSSYIPTGKGFSNYIPNVEVPSKEGVVSAFKSSHYRDPNKSYAEQLYDFSKTPVGAGTIAGEFQHPNTCLQILILRSGHWLRLCLLRLRRVQCICASQSLERLAPTHGVPLAPPHARFIIQACTRSR